ncbi:MAG: hypothetical protein HYU84_15740, partial [Chloroflexi bacterium]|nr:hypothetical protein [Chloroflexota bacterium]
PFQAKETRASAADYANFRELVLKSVRIREIRGKKGFENPCFLVAIATLAPRCGCSAGEHLYDNLRDPSLSLRETQYKEKVIN